MRVYFIVKHILNARMSDESELLTRRVIIPMAPSMISRIRKYRFAAQRESQADAIRALIEIGLDTVKAVEKSDKTGS